jgi:hypothetical protein
LSIPCRDLFLDLQQVDHLIIVFRDCTPRLIARSTIKYLEEDRPPKEVCVIVSMFLSTIFWRIWSQEHIKHNKSITSTTPWVCLETSLSFQIEHGSTDEVNTNMNLPSNCWLFCVTRNSHFRRVLASVVLKFNKESNRKTPFERRKIVLKKSALPTAIFGMNSSRVTVSDHFYWFPFIKSVNITFYLAKVCFIPYLLLKIVKYTCWEFQMLMYK